MPRRAYSREGVKLSESVIERTSDVRVTITKQELDDAESAARATGFTASRKQVAVNMANAEIREALKGRDELKWMIRFADVVIDRMIERGLLKS